MKNNKPKPLQTPKISPLLVLEIVVGALMFCYFLCNKHKDVSTFSLVLSVALYLYAYGCLNRIIAVVGNILGTVLSGYKLLFFAIGNRALKRVNGKYKIVKISNNNLAWLYQFQPPKSVNGSYPLILTNITGDVICILLGIFNLNMIRVQLRMQHFLMTEVSVDDYWALLFFAIGGFVGLFDIFNSKYPFRPARVIKMMPLCTAMQNDEVSMENWANRLEYIGRALAGERPKDMPIEIFGDANNENFVNDYKNSTRILLYINKLMDERKYNDALYYVDKLLSLGSRITAASNDAIWETKIRISLLKGGISEEIISKYQAIISGNYSRSHGKCPHLYATIFAFELLNNRDTAKAKIFLDKFDKNIDNVLLTGEREAEKQFVSAVIEAGNKRGLVISR